MRIIYIFFSIFLLGIFSIHFNILGTKDKIYSTYPNLELRKKIFKKYNVMPNLENDYNVDFLPKTEFVNINFQKVKLNFSDKFKPESQKGIYGGSRSKKIFFIELIENDIWIVDLFGHVYVNSIKELEELKNKVNLGQHYSSNKDENLTLKIVDSNLKSKFILDTLFYEKNLYIYYKEKINNCWNIGIAVAKIDLKFLDFQKFFKSDECQLNNVEIGRMQPFTHNDVKGILFSSNSFVQDKPEKDLAQDDNSIYGKLNFINLEDKKHHIFSKGHRSLQGLYVKNELILGVEHGPRGGDEINKISFGENYGWPISSYGEKYFVGYSDNPYYFKDHETHGFKEPLFSFVPSIAISEIIKLPNNFSNHYIDNFILSTLSDKSLYRIKFDKNYSRVLFFEKIYIGQRIRDLKYHNDKKTIFLALENNGEIGILSK